MKRIFFAVLGLVIFFCSCQKGITDLITNTSTTANGSFKAKLNGTQWTANTYGAARQASAGSLPALINITGHSTDKKLLTITLVDSGVHQYTILPDGSNFNAAAWQDSTLANVNAYTTNQAFTTTAPTGTVNITKIDTSAKTISGTFSFVVYRMIDSTKITISEGSFTNVPLAGNALPPANNATDTFRVKIDGTSFTPYSISANSVAGMLVVQGANQSLTKNVAITMPPSVSPGTYTLDLLGGTYIGLYNEDANSFGSMGTGTLQVLEHNTTTKRIRANFSFTGELLLAPLPKRQLTEGYFSVVYQ